MVFSNLSVLNTKLSAEHEKFASKNNELLPPVPNIIFISFLKSISSHFLTLSEDV